jgi:hypothetical protein
MDLESLRDLIIVICGILVIATTLILLIVGFLLFRRVTAVLDSIKATVANIQRIASVVSPVRGTRGAIGIITRILRKRRAKTDGQ